MFFIKEILFVILLFIHKVIKQFYIFIPNSKKLNFLYYLHFLEKNAEYEAFNLKKLINKNGTALDIGANYGLFTFGLTKVKNVNKIYAFEPNSDLTKNFTKNNKKIKVFNNALSDQNGFKILTIPIVNNIEFHGWGSLQKDKNFWPKEFVHFKKKKILCKKLDSFNFENINFIKIDVEGHELQVLRGGRKFFLKNRPNCLIEIKKTNLASAKIFFKNLNCNYRFIKNNKLHKSNYLFINNKK